ncbi:hypothetical protein N7449_001842 [Penicillium cf. viridicatum]|uniref:EF-hand domain-containing protein n=1 Tax=Penicillium cf. viridicatum TaxID=2972119 RepID=A0A9W9N8Z9_9EURO|nr:hypothetical protein N7449_001842 [Penicillium cf. viridicatum]
MPAPRYSREEVKKWREVFKLADVNNDHFISTDELMKTAKEQGIEMDDEQAADFIKDFDNNGNGKIEFSGKL